MAKKKIKSVVKPASPETVTLDSQGLISDTHQPQTKTSWVRNILIIAVILIAFLAIRYKNLFIVATVDGQPITRLEFEKELNSKFGASVLENLISEKIIAQQAQKKGVAVDSAAVDSKVKEIEERLKGQMSLDDALKAQGLTRDTFRKQVEIQIAIDKMFDKEATVSEKEIDEYITQNQESLVAATDQAKLRNDVYENLRQQKIGELFDKWFAEVKAKTSVTRF